MPNPNDIAAVATDPRDSVSDMTDPAAVRGSDPVSPPKTVADDDISGFDASSFIDEPLETVNEMDVDEDAPTPAPKPAPKPAVTEPEPKAATPTEPVPPTPVAPVPEPAAVAPTTPVEPVAPSEPPADTAPELTQEQQQEQFTNWFNQSVESLVPVYTLTPEIAAELDAEPSKVFPKLAAQMHMQMVTSAATIAANLFQSMLPQYQERQAKETAIEQTFYEKFPALKAHKQEVDNLARVYAQTYPTHTQAEALDNIGAMAHVRLRLPLPQTMQPPVIPVPTAVTPTGATGGIAAPAPLPGGQQTTWEDLIQEE